jgi:hypothetical protein
MREASRDGLLAQLQAQELSGEQNLARAQAVEIAS